MIRRIKNIRYLGPFRSFLQGGPLSWEQLTLIYGDNGYGKSTLTSLLRSVDKRDASELVERTSVDAPDSATPEAIISLSSQKGENTAQLKNRNWDIGDSPFRIMVFDSNFVNSNIYTGDEMTRANREEFTNFALGELVVDLERQLKRFRDAEKDLRRKTKATSEELEGHIPRGMSVDEFATWEVNVSEDSLLEEQRQVKAAIEKNESRRTKLQAILSTGMPEVLPSPSNFIERFENINYELYRSPGTIASKALKSIEDHITDSFRQRDDEAFSWLHKGLSSYLSNSWSERTSCPFCGNPLQDAIHLIENYEAFFNKAYSDEVQTGLHRLDADRNLVQQGLQELKSLDTSEPILQIQDFLAHASVEPDDISAPKTRKLLEEVAQKKEQLVGATTDSLANAADYIDRKQKTPHESVPTLDLTQLERAFAGYQTILSKANAALKDSIAAIRSIKERLSTQSLEVERESLSKELTQLDNKLLRIRLDVECGQLLRGKKRLHSMKERISKKVEEIQEVRSQYLSRYFDGIQRCLDKIGSGAFSLEPEESKQGDRPVVGVQLNYRGKRVNPRQLSHVLSESDKRALGFAVFWAQLETLSRDELTRTIVVLDDPVVSFDDNRIQQVTRELISMSQRCAQLVVLSHYGPFLQRLYRYAFDELGSLQTLRISRQKESSVLESADLDTEFLSEQERRVTRLHAFINREISDVAPADLRLVLEQETRSRFGWHIREAGMARCKFRQLVEKLKSDGSLESPTAEEIMQYWDEFSPMHHESLGLNHEELRERVRSLLEFVYVKLHAASAP